MQYLLDTHTLLWAIHKDNKLSKNARAIIEDLDIVCYFSMVSLWEITIKNSLGALDLKMSLAECFDIITDTGFTELRLYKKHFISLKNLPNYHKDPFDRLLIAQAISENITLISKDGNISKYDVPICW